MEEKEEEVEEQEHLEIIYIIHIYGNPGIGSSESHRKIYDGTYQTNSLRHLKGHTNIKKSRRIEIL